MADNFISGNNSYVLVGATPFQFGKWTLPVEAGNKKFFAFGSRFQRTLPGGIAGTPVCEGPYDAGNMPLTIGELYELHLGFAPGIELVMVARLASVEYSTEIGAEGDPAQCSATFDSHGAFTIGFS